MNKLKSKYPTPLGELGFLHGKVPMCHYFCGEDFRNGASEAQLLESLDTGTRRWLLTTAIIGQESDEFDAAARPESGTERDSLVTNSRLIMEVPTKFSPVEQRTLKTTQGKDAIG